MASQPAPAAAVRSVDGLQEAKGFLAGVEHRGQCHGLPPAVLICVPGGTRTTQVVPRWKPIGRLFASK
jgi:hypothetical protein